VFGDHPHRNQVTLVVLAVLLDPGDDSHRLLH
jgi:hypothetical protein